MSLYEMLYQNMENLSSFYRFEGYHSTNYYDVSIFENKDLLNPNHYVYFSKNAIHHAYYKNKRILQLLNREILFGLGLDLRTQTLCDYDKTCRIIKCINNDPISKSLNSIEFCFCTEFLKIIKNNGEINMKPKEKRGIEIVDLKRKGGGYGFCNDWLKLFNLLTIIYYYRQITLQDIQETFRIYRMHKLHCVESIKTTSLLQSQKSPQKIIINPQLQSSFTKYEIADSMELLIDQGLVNPNSTFGKYPRETIKNTISCYEKTRKRTLETLAQFYEK